MRVHLEGMGVIGSILAWELDAQGFDWTWNDIEAPVNAWSACTGAIFPSGDATDEACRRTWFRWISERSWLSGFFERADWWFCTKAAPHKARFASTEEHGLRRSAEQSLHFNAQQFVPMTRSSFEARRLEEAPRGARLVVTHGFGARLDHYVWGWTVLVQMAHLFQSERRPAVYLRKGRFVMAYAYPVAGTPWWYAGSNLIVQRRAKELEVGPKYERWLRAFAELSGGIFQIVEQGDVLTGWRPAPKYDYAPLLEVDAHSIRVRPHWHNGVRRSPAIVEAVTKELLS
jgi:hypothetical protein